MLRILPVHACSVALKKAPGIRLFFLVDDGFLCLESPKGKSMRSILSVLNRKGRFFLSVVMQVRLGGSGHIGLIPRNSDCLSVWLSGAIYPVWPR